MATSQDIINQNTSETDNRTPFEIANERMNEQIENFSGIDIEGTKITISYDQGLIRFASEGEGFKQSENEVVLQYESDSENLPRLIRALGNYIKMYIGDDSPSKEFEQAYESAQNSANRDGGNHFVNTLLSELPNDINNALSVDPSSAEVLHTIRNLHAYLLVPIYEFDGRNIANIATSFAAFLRITEFMSLAWGGDKTDHDPQVPFVHLERIIRSFGEMKKADGVINYEVIGPMPRNMSFLRILDILELVINAQKVIKNKERDNNSVEKSIAVAVNSAGDHIVYSVSDKAKGIAKDTVKSLFTIGSSDTGSTGLGLNLLLHNASTAGGSVRVSSIDSEGKYAVKVTLDKDGQVVVEDLKVEPDFEASGYDTTIDIIIPNAEASENT